MKRFKELRNEIGQIAEEHSEGGGLGFDPVLKSRGRSAQNDIKPTNYDDPYDMQKVNAFITAFTSQSYVDPRSALYLLRAKLNLTGIDFDVSRATDLTADQDYSFPLKRFGGTFGTSPSHNLKDGFERTNGFDGRNYVLKCRINAPTGGGKSGLFMLDAHIEEV
jgi:hypothetical protein